LLTLSVQLLSPPFFLLLLPHTPRSTLFPYTTLFRSQMQTFGLGLAAQPGVGERRANRGHMLVDQRLFVLRFVVVARHPDHTRDKDRKSTRLNSSHLGISYAVFCLKKKKIKK